MINEINKNCTDIQLNMTEEQINVLIKICEEDLVESFGTYSEDKLYQLSLSRVRLTWARFIKQYSNNPLNNIIDVDKTINEENVKIKVLLECIM